MSQHQRELRRTAAEAFLESLNLLGANLYPSEEKDAELAEAAEQITGSKIQQNCQSSQIASEALEPIAADSEHPNSSQQESS